MLKNYVSQFLSKYLGSYIEDLDTKNLELGFLSGDVTLRNLKLKKSALEKLELPIFVSDGVVQELVCNIPWRSLNSKPVIIKIKGVYLLTGPMDYTKCSRSESISRELFIKKKKLQLSELLELKKLNLNEDNEKGFFDKFFLKVVDNVQVYIEDVNVRYEDKVSNENNPFTFGVMMEYLHIQSADSTWKPTFLNVGNDVTYKIVNLKNMAVYLDTVKNGNSTFVEYADCKEMVSKLKVESFNKDTTRRHHYLLTPISGTIQATLNRGNFNVAFPLLKVDAELDKISIGFTSSQYRRLVDAARYFTKYNTISECFEYYPKFNTSYTQNPRAWWRYAVLFYKVKVHKTYNTLNREYIRQYLKNRDVYLRLYELKINNRISNAEYKQLETMEEQLEYADIVFFRQIVLAKAKKKKVNETSRVYNYFKYVFDWSSRNDVNADSADSEQLMREIYETFADEEHDKFKTIYPPEYVKHEFQLKFLSCSFSLRRDDFIDEAEIAGLAVDKNVKPVVLQLVQNQFKVLLKLSEQSFVLESSLDSVNAMDFYTLEGDMVQTVRSVIDDSGSDYVSEDDVGQLLNDKFFNLKIEYKMSNQNNLSNLFIKLDVRSVYFTFSRKLFDYITFFFKDFQNRSQIAIPSSGIKQWESFRKSAQSTIKNSMNRCRTIVRTNFSSPCIFIPLNFTDPHCPVLVFNLGHISLCNDTDMSESYKKFQLAFRGINFIVLGGKHSNWQDDGIQNFEDNLIIENFDLDVALKVYNDKRPPKTPFFAIKSSVNYLKVHLVDWKLMWMLDILQAATTFSLPEQMNLNALDTSLSSKEYEVLSNFGSFFALNQSPNADSQSFTFKFDLFGFEILLLKAEGVNGLQQNLSGILDFFQVEISRQISLFNLKLDGFQVAFNLNSDCTSINMSAGNFDIEDIIGGQVHLLSTIDDVKPNEKFMVFSYKRKMLSEWTSDDVENDILLQIKNSTICINRISISYILQIFSDYTKYTSYRSQRIAGATERDVGGDIKKSHSKNTSNSLISLNSQPQGVKNVSEVPHVKLRTLVKIGKCSICLNRGVSTAFELVLCPSVVNINNDSAGTMLFKANLGSVIVKFLHKNSIWRNVISVNESLGTLDLELTFCSSEMCARTGYDILFKCQMNSLHFMFFKVMIAELSNYFNAFEKIRKEVKFSTGYYAIGAIENVSKLSKKIMLEIDIENPTFTIPGGGDNSGALVFELGNISLRNSYTKMDSLDGELIDVFVDKSEFHVVGMNLKMIKSGSQNFAEYLIDGCSFQGTFLRILNSSRRKQIEIPDFFLLLFLPDVNLAISQPQVCELFRILWENFSEEPVIDSDDLETIEQHLNDILTSTGFLLHPDSFDVEGGLTLKCVINMDKLRANLSKKVDEDCQEAFLLFTMREFQTKVLFNTGREIRVDAQLKEIKLSSVENTENQNVFSNIWESQLLHSDEGVRNPMLSFKYCMLLNKKYMNTEVELSKPRLYIVSSVAYSLYKYYSDISRELADIFSGVSEYRKFKNAQSVRDETYVNNSTISMNLTTPESHVSNNLVSSTIQSTTTMSLVEPEICVIGDSKSSIPACFIAYLKSFSYNVMQFCSGKTCQNYVFIDLIAYRCFINVKNNMSREKLRNVFNQKHFKMEINSMIGAIKNISFFMSSIKIFLAYSDVKIAQIMLEIYEPLFKQIRRLSEKNENISDSTQSIEKESQSLSSEDDKSYCLFDSQKCQQPFSLVKIDQYLRNFQVKINILDNIKFTFINDTNNLANSLPVFKANFYDLEIDSVFYLTGTTESLIIVNTMEIYLYNEKLTAYEPLLEIWGFSLQLSICNDGKISACLKSDETLDLNFTILLVKTAFELQHFFEYLSCKLDMSSFSENQYLESTCMQCYILNLTGSQISYSIENASKPQKTLLNHSQKNLIEFESLCRLTNFNTQPSSSIKIEFNSDGFEGLGQTVSLKLVKTCYQLSPSVFMICSTEFDKNYKNVVIHGNFTLKNYTTQNLVVSVFDHSSNSNNVILTLNSMSSNYLPIKYANYDSFWISPAEGNFEPSAFLIRKNLKRHSRTVVTSLHRTEPISWTAVVFLSRQMLNENMHEFVVEFNPIITFKNALVSEITVKLLTADEATLLHSEELVPISKSKSMSLFNNSFGKTVIAQLFESVFQISIPSLPYCCCVECGSLLRITGNSQKLTQTTLQKKIYFNRDGSTILTLFADIEILESGSCSITIFSAYWLINCSGLPLEFTSKKDASSNAPSQTENLDLREWYAGHVDQTVEYGYAYNRYYYHSSGVCVRTYNSEWSKSLALGIQTLGELNIPKSTSKRSTQYSLGISVVPGVGNFYRTKVVKFYPAYMVFNACSTKLYYTQFPVESSPMNFLEPNEQIPFYFEGVDSHKKSLIISVEGHESSVPFSLCVMGSFRLKLRDKSENILYINVIIRLVNCTTYAVFGDETANFNVISYVIDNRSSFTLAFNQVGVGRASEVIGPKEVMEYYWDRVQIQKSMLELGVDDQHAPKVHLSLDKVASYPTIPAYDTPIGKKLQFSIKIEKFSKFLIIEDLEIENLNAQIARDDENWANESINIYFRLELATVGISIIDSVPQELIYVSFGGIFAEFVQSLTKRTFEFIIEKIQADNQLSYTSCRTLLLCVPPLRRPSFQLSVVQSFKCDLLKYFDYFGVQIQTLNVCATKKLLIRILDLVGRIMCYTYQVLGLEAEKQLLVAKSRPIYPLFNIETLQTTETVFFEFFRLNSMRVNVSFVVDVQSESTKKSTDAHNTSGVLGMARNTVGLLTNVDKVPLRFNALMLKNPHCNWNELLDLIVRHYSISALKQWYKMIGCMELFGSPLNFATNIGTGVKDFFYEPAIGAVESPAEFSRGLAKGAKSLASKTTYAIIDSAGKIINNVASVGSKLTFDKNYQNERANRQHNHARHTGEGLVYGLHDLGTGVYDGIKGIIMDPIHGASKNGTVGFLKGLSKGITGVFTKPTVGAIDFVTRTLEGVKNTIVNLDIHSSAPVRLPRYIHPDKIIRTYNYQKSLGQQILMNLEERRGLEDIYIAHIFSESKCFLFTGNTLLVLRKKTLNIDSSKWTVHYTVTIECLKQVHISRERNDPVAWHLSFLIFNSKHSHPKKISIVIANDFDASIVLRVFKKFNIPVKGSTLSLQNYHVDSSDDNFNISSSESTQNHSHPLKRKIQIRRRKKEIQSNHQIDQNDQNCRCCCSLF